MPRHCLLILVLLVAGCGRKSAGDEASIRGQLERKGTIDLMDQVAKAPAYKPPADGRLTQGQVRMYLDVRLREQRIREVASKSASPADATTADLRAAQELGFNPKEYQWVRERVMDAQMLQATQALNQQVALSREALLRSLEEQKKTAGAGQQAEIDQHIQDLRTSVEGVVDRDPAKNFNARLLEELQKGPSDGH